MKKPWIIISGVVIVIVAAVIYVAVSSPKASTPSDSANETASTQDTPEVKTDTPAPAAPAQPGAYTAYDPELLSKTTGRKILFFHASWCPQCQALDKSIKEGPIPDGVTFFKVDYDAAHDLRIAYGVNLQTTLVEIDQSGHVVKKYVAYDEPTLQAALNGLQQ